MVENKFKSGSGQCVFLAAIDKDGQNYHIEEILKYLKENAIDIKPAFFPILRLSWKLNLPRDKYLESVGTRNLEFLLNRGYKEPNYFV